MSPRRTGGRRGAGGPGPGGRWPGQRHLSRLLTHRSIRRQAEEGSGSVLVLGCCAALTLLLAASVTLAGLVSDVHRARAAADLAALAAVSHPADGVEAGCATAAVVAGSNGATLSSCTLLADDSVLVSVRVPVTLRGDRALGVLPREVSARARAGVVSEPLP